MGPLSKFTNHAVSSKEFIIEEINQKNPTGHPLVFLCIVILSNKEEKKLYLDQDQLKEFSKNKKLTLSKNEYRIAQLFKNRIHSKTSNDLDDELMFKFDSEDEKEFKKSSLMLA